MSRQRTAPPSIVDHVDALSKRLAQNENARRIGFTSFDEGTLVLEGFAPEIVLSPTVDSPSDIDFRFFSFDSAPPDQVSCLAIMRYDPVQGKQAGGKVQFDSDRTILSHFDDAAGLPEGMIWINYGDIPGLFYFQGSMSNQQANNPLDMFHIGNTSLGAGFTGIIYTYPLTFSSTTIMKPVCTVLNSAGAVSWCLTAYSNVGFTIAWTGTLAKDVTFWCVRN